MKKVIIDCDPGHDDALAILLAAGHLDVLGITTVGGNQTLEKVTNNTLKILECAGLTHIPVARGMGEPLMAPRIDTSDIHGPDVHGTTGLDGPELPEPDISIIASHGVDFILTCHQCITRDGVGRVDRWHTKHIDTVVHIIIMIKQYRTKRQLRT